MTISLDEVTREMLDIINEMTGASRSAIIRRSVLLYLEKLEGPGFYERALAEAKRRGLKIPGVTTPSRKGSKTKH